MKKILVIIGTRPEAIKLFPVVHALRDDPQFDCVVCTTGQHREMVDDVLDFAGVVPDYRLDAMKTGQSLDELTARLMMQIGPVIDKVKPDWVVVQGDTTSAFCGALAAYYRRIRVCHVEAGLRTGDIHQPWPEEANRKMIATFATLHCAPTEGAAENLRREGVAAETIHITGNTVVDALQWTQARLRECPELARQITPYELRFAGRKIVTVTCHRRENDAAGMARIEMAITAIADRDGIAAILPVHPGLRTRMKFGRTLASMDNVVLIEPLDYPNFIRLLMISHLILTDSGGVQEEAVSLGIPALVLRNKTERPEGVLHGTLSLVGVDPTRISLEAARLLTGKAAHDAEAQRLTTYGSGRSANGVIEAIKACKQG